MSHRIDAKRKQFYRQLKKLVQPELLSKGFDFDGKRVFRKSVQFDSYTGIQIIEFQLGIKSLVGKFTANVGVFSSQFYPKDWHPIVDEPLTYDCFPAMWKRLGCFFDPPQSWIRSVLGCPKPPRSNYWWEQYADEQKMAKSLQSALTCLKAEVLPWLDLLTCLEAFEWAISELARAKRWKESLGTPGAERYFYLKYYSDIVQQNTAPNPVPPKDF
jgi:hypothetical protein